MAAIVAVAGVEVGAGNVVVVEYSGDGRTDIVAAPEPREEASQTLVTQLSVAHLARVGTDVAGKVDAAVPAAVGAVDSPAAGPAAVTDKSAAWPGTAQSWTTPSPAVVRPRSASESARSQSL